MYDTEVDNLKHVSYMKLKVKSHLISTKALLNPYPANVENRVSS